MLRTWLEPEDITVPDEYIEAIGGNPMVSRVLFTRGFTNIEAAKGFLSPEYYRPTPATDLPGLVQACDLLIQAIQANKVIGVWGDFDVDGQTSTTLLVSALRDLGADVIYHIPVRAEESHGISLPVLQKFLKRGVNLILTCDTGISSHEAIDYAQQNKVPVIITDHHDLPKSLPQAAAIVNPKLLPEIHPAANLPGVGVAYKIVEGLYDHRGADEATQQYLDLVALGVVADIALLQGDNRYLLQLGLEALRSTKRVGLLAMMELAELNQENLTEEHIAYILAPRMNALGRLDDANSMVELLTTRDLGKARVLALELEGMNAQRKLLSDQVYHGALAQITADPKVLDFPVLVLSHPSWPAGVIGVVASRLVEQYHRPVILFSAPMNQVARGSARSIEGINITSAIAANQKMLVSYGGHPMAAGLAIQAERIPELRKALARTVKELGVEVQGVKELHVDGYLALPDLSLELVEDLERLSPYGAGNPPLVFATRNLKITGYVAVGRSGEHLHVGIEDELGHSARSIWWQGAGNVLPESRFDLTYSVRASTYRGQRDIQIEWIDYRPVENQGLTGRAKKKPMLVVDLRTEAEPLTKLKEILEQEKLIVWAEAKPKQLVESFDRRSIYPADGLAIWSIPPGPAELQMVLDRVNPLKVYLFAMNPGMDEPQEFLQRLAGLLKNILNSHHGETSLTVLAAATAQRIQSIQAGLEWLDERGHIKLAALHGDEVKIDAGLGRKKPASHDISTRLNSLLAESAAYRRYYLSANPERLVSMDVKS